MSAPYYVRMDDGRVLRIEAISAAMAQCTALEEHLTHKVEACWSGSPHRDPECGYIDYDVPRHVALREAPPKRRRKLPDRTVPMFPDEGGAGAHKDA